MAIVHIIGAGISGLAAATRLAEAHVPVRVYEATAHAGGRARSSHDPKLGSIDHGLHVISGDAPELMRYLTRIGAQDTLTPVRHPLAPRPAPLADYLALIPALLGRGPLVHRLPEDNILRAGWLTQVARLLFHTPLERLGGRPLRRALLRIAKAPTHAGRAFMPAHSLSATFITPALNQLDYMGGSIYFSQPLKSLERQGGRITQLTFARQKVSVSEDDIVIFALPAHAAAQLLPELPALDTHSAITFHFTSPHHEPVGMVSPTHAPVDLIRYSEGRISASIRLAGHVWHSDPALLAGRIWTFLASRHPYLNLIMPAYSVWREKQAGHSVTGEPFTLPSLGDRLLLAGDWCDAELPSCLEIAAASGHRTAEAALHLLGKHPLRTQ